MIRNMLVGAMLASLALVGQAKAQAAPPTPLPSSVVCATCQTSLSVTSTSSRVALPSTSPPFNTITIYNSGSKDAYYVQGDATAIATTSNIHVVAGMRVTVWVSGTYIAAITAGSDATTLLIYQSNGPIELGFAGVSGGPAPETIIPTGGTTASSAQNIAGRSLSMVDFGFSGDGVTAIGATDWLNAQALAQAQGINVIRLSYDPVAKNSRYLFNQNSTVVQGMELFCDGPGPYRPETGTVNTGDFTATPGTIIHPTSTLFHLSNGSHIHGCNIFKQNLNVSGAAPTGIQDLYANNATFAGTGVTLDHDGSGLDDFSIAGFAVGVDATAGLREFDLTDGVIDALGGKAYDIEGHRGGGVVTLLNLKSEPFTNAVMTGNFDQPNIQVDNITASSGHLRFHTASPCTSTTTCPITGNVGYVNWSGAPGGYVAGSSGAQSAFGQGWSLTKIDSSTYDANASDASFLTGKVLAGTVTKGSQWVQLASLNQVNTTQNISDASACIPASTTIDGKPRNFNNQVHISAKATCTSASENVTVTDNPFVNDTYARLSLAASVRPGTVGFYFNNSISLMATNFFSISYGKGIEFGDSTTGVDISDCQVDTLNSLWDDEFIGIIADNNNPGSPPSGAKENACRGGYSHVSGGSFIASTSASSFTGPNLIEGMSLGANNGAGGPNNIAFELESATYGVAAKNNTMMSDNRSQTTANGYISNDVGGVAFNDNYMSRTNLYYEGAAAQSATTGCNNTFESGYASVSDAIACPLQTGMGGYTNPAANLTLTNLSCGKLVGAGGAAGALTVILPALPLLDCQINFASSSANSLIVDPNGNAILTNYGLSTTPITFSAARGNPLASLCWTTLRWVPCGGGPDTLSSSNLTNPQVRTHGRVLFIYDSGNSRFQVQRNMGDGGLVVLGVLHRVPTAGIFFPSSSTLSSQLNYFYATYPTVTVTSITSGSGGKATLNLSSATGFAAGDEITCFNNTGTPLANVTNDANTTISGTAVTLTDINYVANSDGTGSCVYMGLVASASGHINSGGIEYRNDTGTANQSFTFVGSATVGASNVVTQSTVTSWYNNLTNGATGGLVCGPSTDEGPQTLNCGALYEGNTAIASKYAPSASPTFTGTVTFPDGTTATSTLFTFGANESMGNHNLTGIGNLISNTSTGPEMYSGTPTGTVPAFGPNRSDTKSGIGADVAGDVSLIGDNAGTAVEIMRITGTNINVLSHTISGAGTIASGNNSGYEMTGGASTATVPTFVPNQGSLNSGVGGVSGTVALITGGVNAFTVDSGQLLNIGANSSQANGTATVAFTALGPTGTACVVGDWFKIKDSGGNTRYIPMMTCS